MAAIWRLEPDSAASVIASVAATRLPAERFVAALSELADTVSASPVVARAAETFGTRHRDVPPRLQQRIVDVAAAGSAVVTTIGIGDDLMAAEVQLANAAEAEAGSGAIRAMPGEGR